MVLNKYGDSLIKTTGSHGADISSQRIDDLDLKSLEYVLHSPDKPIKGIDIGCGSGIHGIRLALMGAEMVLLDILDINEKIKLIADLLSLNQRLIYIKQDVRNFNIEQLSSTFSFAYSQRFIHYLTYQEAVKFVSHVAQITKKDGLFFISASGINSELSDQYEGREMNIDQRYFYLIPAMAEKHNILEKVCLYSRDDLSNLLEENGFQPLDVWESSFGNVKAVAKKLNLLKR